MNNECKINWVSIASLVVAFTGILSGVLLNKLDRDSAIEIKKYEVTFIEKQKAYAGFIESITKIYFQDFKNTQNNKVAALMSNVELKFYLIEPFLSADTSKKVWFKLQEYLVFAGTERKPEPGADSIKSSLKFAEYRNGFRQIIFSELFKENPASNKALHGTSPGTHR